MLFQTLLPLISSVGMALCAAATMPVDADSENDSLVVNFSWHPDGLIGTAEVRITRIVVSEVALQLDNRSFVSTEEKIVPVVLKASHSIQLHESAKSFETIQKVQLVQHGVQLAVFDRQDKPLSEFYQPIALPKCGVTVGYWILLQDTRPIQSKGRVLKGRYQPK